MWNDVRLAARLLAKNPGFTAAAVLVLAIGMSAAITMFTLIHGVYLRDLPFRDPDRIVAIGTRALPAGAIDNWSLPDLQDLQQSVQLFDDIAAADEESMDLADADHAPERLVGAWVSANAFTMIGHAPALGRGFTAEDDRPGSAPQVILGHDIWRRRYGGDPAVIGRPVRVNGTPATVIGVMAEGFGFPTQAQLWQPLAVREGERRDRGNRNIDVFGRMAAGVTMEQAQADLGRVMSELAREFPETNADVGAIVRPFRSLTTSGPIQTVFASLMGAGLLLLLIACANVANLLLARGATRAGEVSVRLSLGASRFHVVRQLLAESLLLAIVAGTVGMALGAVGVRAFQLSAASTGAPYWVDVPFEAGVFAFVATVCLGTAVLCGLAPALHTARVAVTGIRGRAAGAVAESRRARRLTDGFVVAQLAISLTMLAAAGLWMRHVSAFANLDIGVDTSGLSAAVLTLPERTYPDDEARRAFYRRFREQLAALPRMQAGLTSAAPVRGAARRRVFMDGRQGEQPQVVSTAVVTPGYLETLGLSPLAGRLFTPADERSSRSVVVNERFAGLYFPGEEAVGRTVWLEPPAPGGRASDALTIVGVVRNVRQASPRQETVDGRSADAVMYLPYAFVPLASATIVVRSDAGAGGAAPVLRQALAAVDPDLPLIGGVTPLAEVMEQELGVLRLFGSAFGLFAAAALGLAAVGLYGVTAYAVAQRTRELGLRIALGAHARHIWWAVTRRAALHLAIGLSLGLAGALGAGQLFSGALSGVSSRDPVTLIGVAALMIVVAFVACLVPAARAIRLEPTTALRAE